jgi:hypothetical protein
LALPKKKELDNTNDPTPTGPVDDNTPVVKPPSDNPPVVNPPSDNPPVVNPPSDTVVVPSAHAKILTGVSRANQRLYLSFGEESTTDIFQGVSMPYEGVSGVVMPMMEVNKGTPIKCSLHTDVEGLCLTKDGMYIYQCHNAMNLSYSTTFKKSYTVYYGQRYYFLVYLDTSGYLCYDDTVDKNKYYFCKLLQQNLWGWFSWTKNGMSSFNTFKNSENVYLISWSQYLGVSD